MLAGLLFGLAPALRASRVDLNATLKDAWRGSTGAGGRGFRNVLIAGEVALALMLLAGAGLLIESFRKLRDLPAGFEPRHLIAVNLAVSGSDHAQPDRRAALYREAVDRLRARHGWIPSEHCADSKETYNWYMLTALAAALAIQAALAPKPAITGGCNPARVHLTGSITSGAPGPVRYTWVRSDKPSTNTFVLDFDKPGSRPVTYDWLFKGPGEGWVVLQVISPEKVHSEKVRFQVSCR